MFNKNKYYEYLNTIDLLNIIIMFIVTIGFTILGFLIFKKFLYALIGFIIGLVISYILNINRKIKVEKMKWEIDIYNKFIDENK